jgi:hypothetical protein
MKRYINQFNEEELTKVFNSNDKIRESVYNFISMDNSEYVAEIIDMLNENDGLWNYTIDEYNHSYIKVVKHHQFYTNLETAMNSYPLFNYEESQDLLSQLYYGMDLEVARDSVKQYSQLYQELDEKLDTLSENIAEKVVKELVNLLEVDEDYMLEYFITLVLEDGSYDNVYIKSDSDSYIAYEDITKDFA